VKGRRSGFRRNDAGAFLTAMLKSKESVVGEHRGIGMVEDREDAAFVGWLVRLGR
jgi:hypothetical protein